MAVDIKFLLAGHPFLFLGRKSGVKRFDRGGICRVDALLQGVPGHGAVHGACVDEGVTKLFCNEFSHGGLTGSCRTVDSDGGRIHTAGIIPVIPRGVEKKHARGVFTISPYGEINSFVARRKMIQPAWGEIWELFG